MTATVALDQPDRRRGAEERRAEVRQSVERSLARRRRTGRIGVTACIVAVAVSLVPLVALVAYTLSRGLNALSADFFTRLPTPPGVAGGGIENAIVGTGVILGIAVGVAVPVGLMAAIFLVERHGWLANSIRFSADVLSGVPSIAIGI